MDNAEETGVQNEAKSASGCGHCGETKRVLVSFTGTNGPFTREVACPVCGPDVTVTTASIRDHDAAMALVDKRLSLISYLVIVAAVVAAVAYIKATGGFGSVFAKAVEEAGE